MEYELDGQKFRVIGKSGASNPPKEGMWIVYDVSSIPGQIKADNGVLYYDGRGECWPSGCYNILEPIVYSILEPIVAKKRSHKNTPRLTAKERANAVVLSMNYQGFQWSDVSRKVERQLQLHAKAALARSKRK